MSAEHERYLVEMYDTHNRSIVWIFLSNGPKQGRNLLVCQLVRTSKRSQKASLVNDENHHEITCQYHSEASFRGARTSGAWQVEAASAERGRRFGGAESCAKNWESSCAAGHPPWNEFFKICTAPTSRLATRETRASTSGAPTDRSQMQSWIEGNKYH